MKTRTQFRRHVLSAAAALALSPSAFATDYTFSSGTYTTPNPIAFGDALYITPGSYKYIDSAVTNNGSIFASDDLYFQSGNVLTNNGLFDWSTDSGFYDGGYNGGFVNAGVLRKSGGTGTSYVSIIGFSNSGLIDVQTGTINFNAGATFNAGSQFTGAGQAVVSSGATFNGAISSQNLYLTGGTFTGNAAQLSGTANWTAGYLAGAWSLGSGQTLALGSGSYKYLNGSLANSGSVLASDDLYFQSGNTLTNTGVYQVNGDHGLYDGGYNGAFVNSGTFSKTSGSGTTYVSIIGFTNSGVIEAQSGTINFNTGAVFNDGTQFTGAGQVVISNGASFNGGFSTAGNLTFTGGTFAGTAAKLNGDMGWTAGSLTGAWEIASNRTLSLGGGSYKNVNGSLLNNGTVLASDDLYFQSGNTLTNNGLYKVNGDFGLYDGGYNGAFVNNGTFRKSAGGGTTNIGIIGFANYGTIDVQSGTVSFNAGAVFNDGSVFSGPGQVVITNGATFNGGFSTASNLSFASGTFAGNAAQMNGNVTWTSGSLTGAWEVASGQTLALMPGSYKYVNGSLANNGSVLATDDLYLQNGNVLTNAGTYVESGDFGVADGGYNGSFVNNGTYRKSAGTGVSTVSIAGFSNNGVIDAQVGTINFSNVAAFNTGTQFTGAGQVTITNGANFSGAFSTANNLAFNGGTFNGSTLAPATLTAGSATWSAGSLTGNWQTAGGTTLNITGTSYKYLNGSLTNSGHIAASDNLYLQNGNTLTNNGVYEAKGDVSVADGGYSGHFVNAGTFLKSAGTGTTSVAAIDFTNPGTVDVQSGVIALPTNFINPGTLTGTGAFATNLLTNTGHVAPGDGAGTLTLNGNFVQTAAGSMDIQLASSTLFDTFVVNGTAALDGTLALTCIAACDLHTGNTLVILDSTGDLTGTFANVTTAGFGNGFQYSVVYDYTGDKVELTVLNQGTTLPVPEPGSWAMMFAGLGVMGALARRRSKAHKG